MLKLSTVHHIAIITADYVRSKHFYTNILGLTIVQEHYREDRNSYKLDLALGDTYVIELFSFPSPPPRPTQPEACGLRHLAFSVDHLETSIEHLLHHNIKTEPIRIDPYTKKRFTFFQDPDGLPLELYEIRSSTSA
jgi:glyoxylase I family protein